MDMSKLVKPARVRNARRGKIVTLYGEAGTGKTTFAYECWPAPVFLPVENGLNSVPDAQAFPRPRKYQDVLDYIVAFGKAKRAGETDRETLIIDSLTQVDLMITTEIIKEADPPIATLGEFGNGYGAGYDLLAEKQRGVRKLCDGLLDMGVHVVAIAHAVSKQERLPDAESYNRWGVKLSKKSIAEWVDDVDAVIHLKVPISMEVAHATRDKKRYLATTTRGKRIVQMVPAPTSLAKNRFNINKPLYFRHDRASGLFDNPIAAVFGLREDPKGVTDLEDDPIEEAPDEEPNVFEQVAAEVAAEPEAEPQDDQFMENYQ